MDAAYGSDPSPPSHRFHAEVVVSGLHASAVEEPFKGQGERLTGKAPGEPMDSLCRAHR
jgi:hypothetical protein